MTRFMLAAGVAALAISAPAASKPGEHGGGHGGHDAAQQHGGGQAQQTKKAQHGSAHVEARAQAKSQHGNARVAVRTQAKSQPHHQAQRQAQSNQHDKQVRQARANHHQQLVRKARIREAQNHRADAFRNNGFRDAAQRNYARNFAYGVGGCPPGLAKKAVACMPPGQARKLLGARAEDVRRVSAWNEMPVRLRSVYRDTPDYYYRYGDGYAYRVNRSNDVISSLLPLFGAGYGVGQVFPQTYSAYGLPAAYQPFYPSAPGYDYRYANGYVYQVNPLTGMINNVDPMLGYGYGYGQMLPQTYSAYNVPYQYRPMYYDTSDYNYRYAPGAIYQVDPQSSLITGVAALLGPGMTIGQQMPMGYGAYNVPYDYRAQYYDSPTNWYRYANGNIYRVDPATQLVTALVASILT
jgi:hypothetical protein